MIEAVHRDVPWARPVWLPAGEDARSILQAQGPRSLDCYLEEADRVARIYSAFMAAEGLDHFKRLLAEEADPCRASR